MKDTLTILTALLLAPLATLHAASERPNVLFILTDQQQAGMMSCAGNPWLKTPAMDSIARNGARFERAYSVNPQCVPSRTGMITGYMPGRFGVQSNGDKTRLPADAQKQAMGWLFRNAGYETAYGGKVHIPAKIDDCGFDVLTADQRDELATECVAFLKRPHVKPFLLVASFINPHDICFVNFTEDKPAKAAPSKKKPKAYEDEEGSLEERASAAAALKRPDGVSEEEFFAKHCPPLPSTFKASDSPRTKHWSVEQWRLHGWAYCRLTEQVDRQIGQVLQALRDAGLEENTLVVFASDHGEMNGAHGAIRKGGFFEEAARVPFVVSLKGVTKPGLVDNQHLVSSGLDLIPTLCDFAGINPPAALPGRSVRALAEGRTPQEWRPYVVSERPDGRMVCSGRYKYWVYAKGDRLEQLVDLEKDPGEMKNFATDPAYADVLARHRQYLREWVETNNGKRAEGCLIK
jgi:arylsulfatase A-like enzyme